MLRGSIGVVLGGIMLVAACGESSTGPQRAGIRALSIVSPVGPVAVGDSVTLQALAADPTGRPVVIADPRWGTGDPRVARVGPRGVVQTVAPGWVEITVSAGGQSASTWLAVVQPAGFTDLDAGAHHTCALTPAGAAYCWGDGFQGQLGNGASGEESVAPRPAPVAGGLRFTEISAGGLHTCALGFEGQAYCWGWNKFGQLGSVSTEVCGPAADPCSTRPVAVAGAHRFRAIVAGGSHTCGITVSGESLCWGYGAYGRLGDGSATERPTPTPLSGGLRFASLSADGPTCGITLLGTAYCWGYNHLGQLGDGSLTYRLVPTPTAGPTATLSQVVNGVAHTCALTTAGATWCWGGSYDGELGRGEWGERAGSTTPVPAASAPRFVRLAAGFEHTCGITAQGAKAYCWGNDEGGQLGRGAPADGCGAGHACGPAPAPVVGGHAFAVVSPGDNHTCGINLSGETFCWGLNYRGALGTGDTVQRSYAPAPVPAP